MERENILKTIVYVLGLVILIGGTIVGIKTVLEGDDSIYLAVVMFVVAPGAIVASVVHYLKWRKTLKK
jgi:cytochrome c oxidase assembly factor CtaG